LWMKTKVRLIKGCQDAKKKKITFMYFLKKENVLARG